MGKAPFTVGESGRAGMAKGPSTVEESGRAGTFPEVRRCAELPAAWLEKRHH